MFLLSYLVLFNSHENLRGRKGKGRKGKGREGEGRGGKGREGEAGGYTRSAKQ